MNRASHAINAIGPLNRPVKRKKMEHQHNEGDILQQDAGMYGQIPSGDADPDYPAFTEPDLDIENPLVTIQNIKNLINKQILKFRGDSTISEVHVLKIVSTLKDIKTLIINGIAKVLKLDTTQMDLIFPFHSITDDVDTIYKQNKILFTLPEYIHPVEKMFNVRIEPRQVRGAHKNVAVRESFQYVSIKETLRQVLSIPEVKIFLKTNELNCNCNLNPMKYTNIEWQNKNLMRIVLYFDEIEVKNPLGDASGAYKLGMFKFIILNLGSQNNSKVKNIYQIATAYAEDIKFYGVIDILSAIRYDIQEPETEGIQIGDERFFATLCQLSGDNLGFHQIAGLKCGFNGNHICHLCNASTALIQKNHTESYFERNTEESFNARLIQMQINDPLCLHGLKFECPLNKLKTYRVVNNYAFDIMHDLWEGVIGLELSLLLDYFIQQRYFTFDILNQRISWFNYGIIQAKNKPNPVRKSENKINIKESASNVVFLIIYL
jgi:hypothetical protein